MGKILVKINKSNRGDIISSKLWIMCFSVLFMVNLVFFPDILSILFSAVMLLIIVYEVLKKHE